MNKTWLCAGLRGHFLVITRKELGTGRRVRGHASAKSEQAGKNALSIRGGPGRGLERFLILHSGETFIGR